jgi:4-amino-4-deoxy-L-arabinose transferase-like glycosyltransferase
MLRGMSERRQTLFFFLIAFWVLAVGFGLREPWPADEPRFVLVAKQMVDGGDWWFPHRGSELYPDKPPLYFWLLAASHQLIGSWRWSFLLPSLLAGLGTLWLTLDLGRRLWTPRAGLWAAIAVLSAFQFVYQFKRAQIDPTLVLFTTLALYGLCRHVLLGPAWRWFWLGCFSAGLGVVAKGVGFLPLLALLPFGLMRWRAWNGLAPLGRGNAWRWVLGAVAFFAAIALWFGPMVVLATRGGDAEHAAYLHNILFKQTAERYAEAWHHVQPPWYFLEVIAMFWLPFSLVFAWVWRDWRDAWRARDARVWLLLSWALIVVVFFSLSAGKRDMYILPALPAFALAAAPYLDALATRAGFRRTLLVFTALLSTLLLAIGLWGWFGHPKFAQSLVDDRGLGAQARWLWQMLAVVGGIGLVAVAIGRVRGALAACAVLLVAVWTGYGLVAHVALDGSSSSRDLMVLARAQAGPGVTIGLVDWKEQNLLQAAGPVTEFGFLAAESLQLQRGKAWLSAEPSTRRLFAPRGDAVKCVDFTAADARKVGVANRSEWWLLGPSAVASCR